jgi:hypothetical protein
MKIFPIFVRQSNLVKRKKVLVYVGVDQIGRKKHPESISGIA